MIIANGKTAQNVVLNILFGEIRNGVIIIHNIFITILLTKHYYLLINLQYTHGKTNYYSTMGGNNTIRLFSLIIPLQV